MIYLRTDKHSVHKHLARLVLQGQNLLFRTRAESPSDSGLQSDIERWFDNAVQEASTLVDECAALMTFRASYFRDRWHVNDAGSSVSGIGLRLCLHNHVHVPLSALVDLIREVESALDESSALVEIEANIDELKAAVLSRLHQLHDAAIAEMKDLRRLSTWTYTSLEPLFLELAHNELKPASRRILERFGPRSLALLGQLIDEGARRSA